MNEYSSAVLPIMEICECMLYVPYIDTYEALYDKFLLKCEKNLIQFWLLLAKFYFIALLLFNCLRSVASGY